MAQAARCTGTTTYAYKTPLQLGAFAVATIDGPLANDTLAYTYDELGRATARTLNGVGVSWGFDALGRVMGETTPVGAFTFGYDGATGRLLTATYPNGQTSAYTYQGGTSDRRLLTIHHQHPGATTQSKFDYGYDAVGNILSWQQQAESAVPTAWTFAYDAADQLTRALKQTTGGSPTVLARLGYGYDPAGNRTTAQVGDAVTTVTHDALNRLQTHTPGGRLTFAGTLSEPATVTIQSQPIAVDGANAFRGGVAIPSGTSTVSVVATDASGNAATQNYQVSGVGATATFTDDANGNLTSDGTRTFEWDAKNRLVAVTSGTHRSEFTYDGLDRRVRIVEKDNAVVVRDASLIWAGTAIIEERLSTGVVNRFFGAAEQHNGVVRFVTRDHLGSVREVTDASGVVLTRHDYDPYGQRTRVTGTEDARFGFTGHYQHAESGLALTLYRAYDSGLGRWANEDPIGRVDGPNLFAYVLNNPMVALDSTGLETCVVVTKTSLGVRDHAALFVSRGGDGGTPLLYDPAGAYAISKGGGSGDVVEGNAASLKEFTAFHRGSTVETACKPTSPKEEERLASKVYDMPPAAPFACSSAVSRVLAGSPSFPQVKAGTFFPGNLYRAASKK